jgi:hypothetical protein
VSVKVVALVRLIGRQALLTGLAAVLWLVATPCQASFRPSAAVPIFQNVSVYSGHLLGRRAADGLALDLGATGVWRVVDRAQTDRACQQRELTPPYAVAYMQELGHALSADVIFSGAIQKLEVDAKVGKIKVAVFAEAIDQVSGQSILATVQSGEARRNENAPEPTDVLIGKALADATQKIAARAAQSTGVIATVSDPGDGKAVTLRLPAAAAIQTGCRFLLYRAVVESGEHVPGKLIAALMVTTAGQDTCVTSVLAKSGDIHTGDIAVSVCCAPKAE